MVAQEELNQTIPSEQVSGGIAKRMAMEEEKKEEEPITQHMEAPTAETPITGMIEPVPQQAVAADSAVDTAVDTAIDTVPAVEEPKQRKSGLKAYLASLASRNKAKKEYLAKLKEQNEAKKKLLKKKKGGHEEKQGESSAHGETVDSDAAVVATKNAKPVEEDKAPDEAKAALVPTTVKVETVASEDSSAKNDDGPPKDGEDSAKENDFQHKSDDKDDNEDQQDGKKSTVTPVDMVDSTKSDKDKSLDGNEEEEEVVSPEHLAKVDEMAQAHVTWTCCAW